MHKTTVIFSLMWMVACSSTSDVAMDAGTDLGARDAGSADACRSFACFASPESFIYDYSCEGEVAATGAPVEADPPSEDCSQGIWPNMDALVEICPTVSTAMKFDPASNMTVPPADTRTLPVSIPVTESGSFLPSDLPSTFPTTIKVVEWNLESTMELDAEIEVLTTHPDLRDADVYVLTDVGRCSTRTEMRRSARMLAEAIGGQYVYGVEYIELSIGRTVGGDRGQAIISRRPITNAEVLCHSSFYDFLAHDEEPRLGQRVTLHADIPAGDSFVRVHGVHYESKDTFGDGRSVQVKETLDVSQRLACDRAQIIAGDLNTWYPEAPELALFRNAGYEDALATVGDTGTTFPGNGFRLDFVFARGLRVTSGGVARDVEPSDHWPVWSVLEVQ